MGEVVVPWDTNYNQAVHLNWGNVQMDRKSKPQLQEVWRKAPKTDPFQQGMSIYVGAPREWLCPVASVFSYMAQHTNHDMPLFMFRDSLSLQELTL